MTARGKSKLHHVSDYLLLRENECETIAEGESYRFGRRLIGFLIDGWLRDPWRTTFVYEYGRHPEFVIPFWLRREAEHRTLYWNTEQEKGPSQPTRALRKSQRKPAISA